MREIEKLKEQILKEYPRMTEESSFSFRCHKDIPCFNHCCQDVNIFLTPYDIIRLKDKLDISSTEFLKKYTLSPFDKNLKYPVIMLEMSEDENKKCPFVSEQGCTVYTDRPWACRMYPLGLASPGTEAAEFSKEFYFLLEEPVCKGFTEDNKMTVSEWLDNQGINDYNTAGEYFKELTTHKYFRDGGKLSPQKIEMFFLACYDVDRFRKFVFESSFLDKFDVDEATQTNLKNDDLELLRFGAQWLRFALFGEETLKVKDAIIEKKKEELAASGKLPKDEDKN